MSYTLKEYRITMPCTVEEYQIAQLYMTAKASENESNTGDGIEILKNEPYTDAHTTGQYTHKLIRLDGRLPNWIKTLIPSLKSLTMEERAWNAYPYCRTVYSSAFFGDKLSMEIRTIHANDIGQTDNIHNLSTAELKHRKIDIVDIVNDPVDKKHYRADEDPSLYHSQKTGRGPLKTGWYKTSNIPHMTCYKLVKVQFKYFGLQNKVESFIHKTAIREQFLLLNRKAFCWTDYWYGMTMNDIRIMEAKTAEKLAQITGNPTQTVEGYSDLPTLAPRYTSSPKSKGRTRTGSITSTMNDLSLTNTVEHTVTTHMNSPASKRSTLNTLSRNDSLTLDTPTQSRTQMA